MQAWKDGRGRRFPNTIAHRGLNVAYPENSMAAFKGAVKVGAHALETDIHISQDNVLVLSHVSYLCAPIPIPRKLTGLTGCGLEEMFRSQQKVDRLRLEIPSNPKVEAGTWRTTSQST